MKFAYKKLLNIKDRIVGLFFVGNDISTYYAEFSVVEYSFIAASIN